MYFLLTTTAFLFICEYYSDMLVEDDFDGTSVAEIFKLYGEGFFREKEVSYEVLISIPFLQLSIQSAAIMFLCFYFHPPQRFFFFWQVESYDCLFSLFPSPHFLMSLLVMGISKGRGSKAVMCLLIYSG